MTEATPFKIVVHRIDGKLSVNLLGEITREEYEKECDASPGEIVLFAEIPYVNDEVPDDSRFDWLDDTRASWEGLGCLSATDGMRQALEILLTSFANQLINSPDFKK
ncbi:MAG: hypothetical protein ACOYUZ_02980 [Patescibacteria group bacterium]